MLKSYSVFLIFTIILLSACNLLDNKVTLVDRIEGEWEIINEGTSCPHPVDITIFDVNTIQVYFYQSGEFIYCDWFKDNTPDIYRYNEKERYIQGYHNYWVSFNKDKMIWLEDGRKNREKIFQRRK